MRHRLADDHANARRLANGVASLAHKGLRMDMSTVQTNIVIFQFAHPDMSTQQLCDRVAEESGVWIIPMGGENVRAVLHYDVGEGDVDVAVKAIRSVVGGLRDV